MTLKIPEARVYQEDTPIPPTSFPQPIIDEPVINTFIEQIRNNKPSTPDSSDQTINILSNQTIEISSDSEIGYETNPITDPAEIDDLVRQFESEANECL